MGTIFKSVLYSQLQKVKKPFLTRIKSRRKIKGCLWLTRGLIILKMKADNDLAINVPVLFESVKKWK